MSKFSEDFFFEILSWLPVSSLLRFRLVCKSWFILITQNSSFAKSQLLRASATQTNNPMVLFSSNHHGTLCSLKYMDIALPLSLSFGNLMKHPATLNNFRFVASCNGLICIKLYLKYKVILCLWNPSTCEIKELPAIPYKHPAQMYSLIAFGFGCNRSLDDYKVVRILQYVRNEKNYISPSPNYDVGDDDTEENLYFVVYTLGTNSWKVIPDMPSCHFRFSEDSSGLHTNGGLHWIGSLSSTESNDDGIISFDIEDEECREVPKPDYLDVMTNATLQVLGGCLCIFNFDSENSTDVWMMKDYGVKESWTKLFTIAHFMREYYQVTLQAFWLFKHGEVLMDLDNDLVLYDPKWERFVNIRPRAFNIRWSDKMIYIESLVSLKSNRELMHVNM